MASSSRGEQGSTSTVDNNLITLRSSDGYTYQVDGSTMMIPMGFLRSEIAAEFGTMVTNVAVRSNILAKVLEYCAFQWTHGGSLYVKKPPGAAQAEIKAWEARFVKDVDLKTLHGLLDAAIVLDIPSLTDLVSLALVNSILPGLEDTIKARSTSSSTEED